VRDRAAWLEANRDRARDQSEESTQEQRPPQVLRTAAAGAESTTDPAADADEAPRSPSQGSAIGRAVRRLVGRDSDDA
jgi:hypothetical protein